MSSRCSRTIIESVWIIVVCLVCMKCGSLYNETQLLKTQNEQLTEQMRGMGHEMMKLLDQNRNADWKWDTRKQSP